MKRPNRHFGNYFLGQGNVKVIALPGKDMKTVQDATWREVPWGYRRKDTSIIVQGGLNGVLNMYDSKMTQQEVTSLSTASSQMCTIPEIPHLGHAIQTAIEECNMKLQALYGNNKLEFIDLRGIPHQFVNPYNQVHYSSLVSKVVVERLAARTKAFFSKRIP